MDKNEKERLRREARAACTRSLAYHPARALEPREFFRALAESTPPGLEPDQYGEGALIAELESEVAALLGKEKAVFFASGTMAQQIAMRIWSERRGTRTIAFHPKCHLELHENKGYQLLHRLHGLCVGNADRLIETADLEAIAQPVAALLLELPQRGIGGQLPAWGELEAAARWARDRDVALHLDGARLWESQPFYARPYAEIASLFDSVYVSFYKTLGAVAGAALAGTAGFVAEARVWQRRHGGTIVHQFPNVLSARAAMRERLPRIGAYCERAREVARVLGSIGLSVVPDPPHANMMHVFLRGDRDRLEHAALEMARERKIWLFGSLLPTPLPDVHKFELTVADATLELGLDEIREEMQHFLGRAGAPKK